MKSVRLTKKSCVVHPLQIAYDDDNDDSCG